MALSGGHWSTLAEAKKLTQSMLIPGVIDEDIKRGNPFAMLPLAQANHTGSSIKWLRSNATATGDVKNFTRGALRTWTESVTYTEVETELRSCNLSRLLDKFNPAIYGTFNNYEEIVLSEMLDAMKKNMGDKIIYDDYTYDDEGLQMDGLHALAAENYGTKLDIDEREGPLSLANMKQLIREMKHGIDFFLVPFWLPDRMADALQQAGFAGLATTSAGSLGTITMTKDDFGKPLYQFSGIPLIPTDFLVPENANTGIPAKARTKNTTGTGNMYSIFAIKLGQGNLTARDPGLKLAFGQTENDGDMLNLEYWDKLETHIGTKGMSITAHTCLINGSSMCVGRIWDVTDAAITA
jgi:hypothetical protein